ncbi:MAG: GNAT family N-acetyltransferase [Bacteroidota bacterium]
MSSRYAPAWQEGAARPFLLFSKSDPEHILGEVQFSNIIRGVFQSCSVGYAVDEALAGQGYMTEALRRGIGWMFREEQLHRVEANIISRNRPSVALVERLGFEEEGRSRRFLKIAGIWQDHLRFAVLAEDWKG